VARRLERGPTAADVFEPLWERIDRNRRRYWILVATYVVVTSAALVFVVWLSVLFVPDIAWTAGRLATVALLTVAGVALYTLYALGNSEKVVLRRVGAGIVGPGQQLETKRALHDMSIAAGLDGSPPLYLIDSPAVNAMVVGRTPETGALAVTRGLAAQLDLDEERAVYAHLLSRLNARDLAWATVSTVLMHPLWVWKKSYYDVVPFREVTSPVQQAATTYRPSPRDPGVPMGTTDMQGDTCMLFPPYLVAVVVAHYLMAGQRRSQLYSAEFADAAGLLLLKDPQPMVSALQKIVRAENYVKGCGGQYAQFFYAWTGELSSNDEGDPEYRRLVRLKQTLGAIAEEEPGPDLSHLLPPRAPRLEELEAWQRETGVLPDE
jgi:Zn-dependent protease with chaperone function